MTHTVILDEAERDRRFVNHLNEILRHCRIGRVRAKAPPVFKRGEPFRGLPLDEPFKRYWKPDPIMPSEIPTPMFMDKCGCRVGSACGNAACPHRMMVTFGRGDISQPPVVPSHGVLM